MNKSIKKITIISQKLIKIIVLNFKVKMNQNFKIRKIKNFTTKKILNFRIKKFLIKITKSFKT